MTSLQDAERAELIALTELRSAIDDLAKNRGDYWTRPGSREHDEQAGEQRAFQRVLAMIDGRINRGNRGDVRLSESKGRGGEEDHGQRVDQDREAAALVLPAEVVPPA